MASETPWYTFPRIDNFGQIDPEGDYYKPDSNIITPYGYSITALLSGVVTSVQRTSWGQTVVTIKLDNPLNSLATHTVYQHMHDATVKQGDVVSAGQLIGHANYAGEGANLGFGLYSGDVYGSGPAWSQLQSDLAPGGAGYLNPTHILDEAKAGQPITAQGGYQTLAYGLSNPFDIFSWLGQFSALAGWVTNPLRLLKLVVGALLVGVSLLMLVAPEIEKTVTNVAGKAAKVGAVFA
jgi:murein DD-endopeptidase MepM/ murein hydrolase activator NlpD